MVELDNYIKNNDINTGIKHYKTPDYIRRAIKNYELKNKDDPDFKQRKLEINKNYREKNAEKTREYKRNYMREYRAKKKAEKNAITEDFQETPNDLTDAVDALSISKD
jgi:hypothetical protein